jgi:hypothetical protein
MALAKSLDAIPTSTRVNASIGLATGVRAAVIAPDGKPPSIYSSYRFTTKLREPSEASAE